jgi:hypothetical protein
MSERGRFDQYYPRERHRERPTRSHQTWRERLRAARREHREELAAGLTDLTRMLMLWRGLCDRDKARFMVESGIWQAPEPAPPGEPTE